MAGQSSRLSMWFTYVLRSIEHKILYTGSTNNLERRLSEHNDGTCKSTKPYRPYELISYIAVQTEKQARELEQYFKTGSGRTILKMRILNDEDLAKHEVMSEA